MSCIIVKATGRTFFFVHGTWYRLSVTTKIWFLVLKLLPLSISISFKTNSHLLISNKLSVLKLIHENNHQDALSETGSELKITTTPITTAESERIFSTL